MAGAASHQFEQARPALHEAPAEPGRGSRGADEERWLSSQLEGEEILDLGCGEGALALLLARQGHTVTAADWRHRSLSRAEALAAAEPPSVGDRIELVAAEPWFVPCDDESFSTVLIRDALEGRIDATPVARELARVLRPSGTAVVVLDYPPRADEAGSIAMTLAKLADAASSHFRLAQLHVADDWVGLRLTRREGRVTEDDGWSAAVAAAEGRATASERALAERDGRIEALRSDLRDRDRALDDARSRAERAADQGLRYTGRIDELAREVERRAAEIGAMADERDRVADERDRAADERGRLVEERDVLRKDRDRLAGELRARTAERDRQAARADGLRERLAAIRASRSYRAMAIGWKARRGIGRLAWWRRRGAAAGGDGVAG